MNFIKVMDRAIHSVPILPKRLQDTRLDRLWKWIERLMGDEKNERCRVL